MGIEELLQSLGIGGGSLSALVLVLWGMKWYKDNLAPKESKGKYPTMEQVRRYVAGELNEFTKSLNGKFTHIEERLDHLDDKVDNNRETLSEKISEAIIRLSEKIMEIRR